MNKTKISLLAASIFAINACGGGGSAGAGIGGTGNGNPQSEPVVVQGTIDGFGSIFVNGIRFEVGSSDIEVDGNAGTEDQLRLGMVVTVRGSLSDDENGTADSVSFDDEVQGPISSISENADGDEKTLVVLGITVLASSVETVFDDVTYETLAVDDVIEVSGYLNADGSIQATRIEKKDDFQAGDSEIELKGLVTNLTATTFELGSFTVDFSSADLSDVPNETLTENLFVEVEGTLDGDVITATEVEAEDDDDFDDDDDVSVEGLITDFVDSSSFRVLGTEVDASGATLSPSDLVLGDNLEVEVEGTIVNGVLVAESVEARDGSVELEAMVSGVDAEQGTLTMSFATESVTVQVNTLTRIGDDLSDANITLADIQQGDFLEIEARLENDNIVATEISREDEADDDEIQGPVEAFELNTSITVLGITYTTTGAEFEGENDQSLSEADFYSALSVGTLVKIKDEQPADGVADEVEFEDD